MAAAAERRRLRIEALARAPPPLKTGKIPALETRGAPVLSQGDRAEEGGRGAASALASPEDRLNIWLAPKTPWRPMTGEDDPTPTVLLPTVDARNPLVQMKKGSPRGDRQAELVSQHGSLDAAQAVLDAEETELASLRPLAAASSADRTNRRPVQGLARRSTPPEVQNEAPLIDRKTGMWVSVEASEEWIAELQGGKGGMQDNWGGAKASANVYAGAEGSGGDNVIEGLIHEHAAAVLAGMRQAEAEGVQQVREARARKALEEAAAVRRSPAASLSAVLPTGWWQLSVALLSIQDCTAPDPRVLDDTDHHSVATLNVYCEIACGAPAGGGAGQALGVHRWECVEHSELETLSDNNGVSNNVALYDGIKRGAPITWTLDERWVGHDIEISVFHYPTQCLDKFRGGISRAARRKWLKLYSQWDCWGVPTHAADGTRLPQSLRTRLQEEMSAAVAQYPKILLGQVKTGLEWFREQSGSGVFSLFDYSRHPPKHVSLGGKVATVELRFEPSVPRARTARELRSSLARRQRAVEARAFKETLHVPFARPFLPSRGPSRWGPDSRGSNQDARDPSPRRGLESRDSGSVFVDGFRSPTVQWREEGVQEGGEERAVSAVERYDVLQVEGEEVPGGNASLQGLESTEATHQRLSPLSQQTRGAQTPSLDTPPKVMRADTDGLPVATARRVVFAADSVDNDRCDSAGGGGEGPCVPVAKGDGAGVVCGAAAKAGPEAQAIEVRSVLRAPTASDGVDGARVTGQDAGKDDCEAREEEAAHLQAEGGAHTTRARLRTLVDISLAVEASGKKVLAREHGGEGAASVSGVANQSTELMEVIGELEVPTPVDGGYGCTQRGFKMDRGLLYHLGSRAGTQTFTNPAVIDDDCPACSSLVRHARTHNHTHTHTHTNTHTHTQIRVHASSTWTRGRPEMVTDIEKAQPCVALNERDAWLCIELPPGVSVFPTAYAVRHGLAGPGRGLRSWQLQASTDGKHWITLSDHHNDLSLHSLPRATADAVDLPAFAQRMGVSGGDGGAYGGYAACTFNLGESMPGAAGGLVDSATFERRQQVGRRNAALAAQVEASSGYRFIKLVMTGPDSSGTNALCVSGLELFGTLRFRAAPLSALFRVAAHGCDAADEAKNGALTRALRSLCLVCQASAAAASAVPTALLAQVEQLASHSAVSVSREARRVLHIIGPPPALHYSEHPVIYACQGDEIDPLRPVAVRGSHPRLFSISPPLPPGLLLHAGLGDLTGAPRLPCRRTAHTVTMESASGSATAMVELHVLPRLFPAGASFCFFQPALHSTHGAGGAEGSGAAQVVMHDAAKGPGPRAGAERSNGDFPAQVLQAGDDAGVGSGLPSMQGGAGSVGLIEYLSSNGLTRDWRNAATSGVVSLSSSPWLTDLTFVLGGGARLSSSVAKRDSWFAVELPAGLWLLPHRCVCGASQCLVSLSAEIHVSRERRTLPQSQERHMNLNTCRYVCTLSFHLCADLKS